CARCDYDLRLIDPAGVCPECALSIAESLKAAADPLGPARATLRAGATFALLALALRAAIVLVLVQIGLGAVRPLPSFLTVVLEPWPVETATLAAYSVLFPPPDLRIWLIRIAFVGAFIIQC